MKRTTVYYLSTVVTGLSLGFVGLDSLSASVGVASVLLTVGGLGAAALAAFSLLRNKDRENIGNAQARVAVVSAVLCLLGAVLLVLN